MKRHSIKESCFYEPHLLKVNNSNGQLRFEKINTLRNSFTKPQTRKNDDINFPEGSVSTDHQPELSLSGAHVVLPNIGQGLGNEHQPSTKTNTNVNSKANINVLTSFTQNKNLVITTNE